MHQAVQRASLRNRYVMGPSKLAGLGSPSDTQMVQQAGQVASAATTAALMGTVGLHGFIFGMASAAAIPLIGAAIVGITIGIVAILNSGCGQTCIVTSNWANQAADLLEQNIKAYFALPAPRPVEAKAQALANFDRIWSYLYSQCASAALGSAGVNCINDRKQGACKWHQTGQPEFPGQPANGECWNWFNSYRDPVENDPAIVTQTTVDPAGVISAVTGATGTGALNVAGVDVSSLVLIGGAALLLFGIAGSK